MNKDKVLRILKSDYPWLVLIAGIGIFVTFIPHFNYPFPIHLDEWFDIACANTILSHEGIRGLTSPFTGWPAEFYQTTETGFHLILGLFQRISGIEWVDIFRFLPSGIFVFTILATYLMTRKLGFGLLSAFFVSLLPTSLGVLGPAFLVPVATGLLFIPLSLFVLFYIKGIPRLIILLLFISFLLASHAYTAIAVVIVILGCLVTMKRENWKSGLAVLATVLFPFAVSTPFAIDLVKPFLEQLFVTQELSSVIDYPFIIESLGYFTFGLCLAGTTYLSLQKDRHGYGILAGFFAMVLILVIYKNFGFGVSGIYERGILYTMLLASIMAGAGLLAVYRLKIPVKIADRLKNKPFLKYTGSVVCAGLMIATLVTVIPVRVETPYYHMIDNIDYEAFLWIQENLGDQYEKAILDPWKGTAFTALTEKEVYSRITMQPLEKDEMAYSFLDAGSSNTTFLRENNISIVYTRDRVNNPDLVQVRAFVYLLE